MVFSSTIFLFLFLPIVLLIHFLLPWRCRNVWLLIASIVFYAWGEVVFCLLMLASILVNYTLGMMIARQPTRRDARMAVGLAVAVNLAFLAIFKYGNFIVANVNPLLCGVGLPPIDLVEPIHLPIGISFYTFQAISYIVDVYRGRAEAQRDPLKVGLYIALFPQLIAGPIVRYHDIASQIMSRAILFGDFAYGVRRFIIGLAKKVLIANTLAGPADVVFSCSPDTLSAGAAWFGTACYAFQIYFDFSGYSDMAIGLGRMFGFRFLENFDHPYISRSMTEFWRRWHISLSTWFRDYLYIPLGGNRLGKVRTLTNLLIVFFLCGLWHGAQWNFVVWGLFHGMFLVAERFRRDRVLSPLWRPVSHLYVCLVCLVSWTLFRADTVSQSVTMLSLMFGITHVANPAQSIGTIVDHEAMIVFFIAVAAILPLACFVRSAAARLRDRLAEERSAVLDLVISIFVALGLAGMFLVAVVKIAAGTYNPFIYFRF
ncbi:MAG: alginate O-acetyltransferase [Lentisphaerae bacterium RIFOXYA12_FULL_48_11]|nr:MAG: alginate O-acetyltransferase [Lentisphaerae bacterium RIFOXYA12_FULL_48_11]